TLFVVEDLTNVTFNMTHHRKQDARYEHHSWRFFDFEEKLMYKALESGSQVLKVSAQFTSQRCPLTSKQVLILLSISFIN
ncbi:IS200/IS605 family accessory protein TnpB-related protein, partial [Aerococcus urinaeequi]|uniref:IS200/IS605 family accessory protein TnpB-related protein n=1 Tax=Aerococcus urinaeequi TaxID=51665 RepID=UPI003EC4A956